MPLQGLLQGRSGLALGVIIPLLSFYFIQLRPKRSQQQHRLNTTPAAEELPPPAAPAVVVVTSSANSNSEDSSNNITTPKEHMSLVTTTTTTTTESAASSQTLKKEPLLHDHHLLSPQHSEEASSSSTTTIVQEATISERALWILRSCSSEWTAVPENAYDEMHNPTGCIQLAVPINKLSLDLIQDWLCNHLSNTPGHETFLNLEEVADYEFLGGLQRVRTVMANFMGIVIGGGKRVMFDPANVIITAGLSAAIEMLVFCLAQPGDAILIPTPYDSRFDKDIKWRTQVEIIPVPCYAHDNFSVTRGNLETAYHSALQRGMTVRAVLLSTPSYPVGNVLDRATLQSILSFTHENSIHLISDEVYAGCVFEDSDFVSVAEILESSECDRSRVHIIYGLSKDLGVVGFQVGVLYSWNMQVIAAARKLTRFCGTSSHTQGILAPLLADESFIKTFLTKNHCRITQRHRKVVTALDAVGIKFAKSSGGLFCWIFLGHCLRSSSQEEETRLCRYVSEEMGVHLTPGSSSCSCPEPGWFSLCFAGVDDQTLNIALQRLQKLAPGVQY